MVLFVRLGTLFWTYSTRRRSWPAFSCDILLVSFIGFQGNRERKFAILVSSCAILEEMVTVQQLFTLRLYWGALHTYLGRRPRDDASVLSHLSNNFFGMGTYLELQKHDHGHRVVLLNLQVRRSLVFVGSCYIAR